MHICYLSNAHFYLSQVAVDSAIRASIKLPPLECLKSYKCMLCLHEFSWNTKQEDILDHFKVE